MVGSLKLCMLAGYRIVRVNEQRLFHCCLKMMTLKSKGGRLRGLGVRGYISPSPGYTPPLGYTVYTFELGTTTILLTTKAVSGTSRRG